MTKPLRPISETALALVKRFEGFSPTRYVCSGGKLTIGYGHVITKAHIPDFEKPITEQRASQILMMDMTYAQQAVDRLVKVPLTQNQFDALVSFVFNIGEGAFAASTLLRLLNKGKYDEAAWEFNRWIHAGGKRLEGLIRRRRAERELFLRD
jgi:lysozyme